MANKYWPSRKAELERMRLEMANHGDHDEQVAAGVISLLIRCMDDGSIDHLAGCCYSYVQRELRLHKDRL